MIHDLAPYPNYRDVGVPWLDRVPAHWEVWRNGRLFAKAGDTGFPELPILEVSLKTGVRVRDFEGSARKQVMAEREKYQRARRGDLAYNMMRLWQGAVGVAPVDGLVSPAYVVARPLPGVESRYYEYLFRTAAYMGEVNQYSRGIVSDRNRLYWEQFKQMPSLVPPADEQVAIVRFLDHADRKIRRYIRAKQKLIRLLEEQKQAVVHRAVTRGLDPDVRLKPSGVDWLGEVPEHWEVVALRHRYSVQLGKMLDTKRITGEYAVPYLRNSDVQWDRINTVDLPEMDIHPSEYSRYTVQDGDLLVCEGGEVGRTAIWNGASRTFGYQKALHRLRPLNTERHVPRFLFYVLFDLAHRGVFLADGSENTIAHLTAEKFRRYRLAFPPRAEQAALVDALDSAVAEIQQLIRGINDELLLLREYRTRLVADVVTGRLDVRTAAADLISGVTDPEADDEAEMLDGEDAEEDELAAEMEEVEV